MFFNLLSSAGVHGVFVLPFFATGAPLSSGGSSTSSTVPPGSPYAPVGVAVISPTVLEPGAFRFLDAGGLSVGTSVFKRLVSCVGAGFEV